MNRSERLVHRVGRCRARRGRRLQGHGRTEILLSVPVRIVVNSDGGEQRVIRRVIVVVRVLAETDIDAQGVVDRIAEEDLIAVGEGSAERGNAVGLGVGVREISRLRVEGQSLPQGVRDPVNRRRIVLYRGSRRIGQSDDRLFPHRCSVQTLISLRKASIVCRKLPFCEFGLDDQRDASCERGGDGGAVGHPVGAVWTPIGHFRSAGQNAGQRIVPQSERKRASRIGPGGRGIRALQFIGVRLHPLYLSQRFGRFGVKTLLSHFSTFIAAVLAGHWLRRSA